MRKGRKNTKNRRVQRSDELRKETINEERRQGMKERQE